MRHFTISPTCLAKFSQSFSVLISKMRIMIEHSRVPIRSPFGNISEALSRVSINTEWLFGEWREIPFNPVFQNKIHPFTLSLIIRWQLFFLKLTIQVKSRFQMKRKYIWYWLVQCLPYRRCSINIDWFMYPFASGTWGTVCVQHLPISFTCTFEYNLPLKHSLLTLFQYFSSSWLEPSSEVFIPHGHTFLLCS